MNRSENMIDKLLDKISGKNLLLFLIIFSSVLILRGPTLFNDYYEADELAAITQARDYIAGYIPNKDFLESKNFLYHAIFKSSYTLSYEYGWVIVHFITILIVFLTSVFIFLTGKKISSFKTGALAAIFYAVLISSFNRQFMATNGEIVYNLFFAMGLYFFIVFLDSGFNKKTFFLVLLMSVGAVTIKFHGLMLGLFVLMFLCLYMPFRKWGIFSLYFGLLCSAVLLALIGLTAGYYLENKFFEKVVNAGISKLYYASAPGSNFSFIDLIARFSFRQGLLSLWHYILWIPGFIYIWKFIRSGFKERELKESAVIIFCICTWLMVFGGGARVYFHYFMAVYPSLAIVSALSLEKLDIRIIENAKKNLTVLVMIPVVFFFAWNTKDVVIKHFFPDAFYNEGKFLYWTRGVLAGTFNDYLLPHNDYKDVVNYIIKTTGPDDPVFVWGDGPYINYFSNRRIGGKNLWMKNTAYKIRKYYKIYDFVSVKKAVKKENDIIEIIQKKKPVLIIDVSGNGLSNFKVNIKEARILYEYVEKNYYFENTINGMDIYRIRR